jgi:hypothetical protein
LEGQKPGENATGKSTKSPSNNSHVVGHGFGVAIDEKATDNPKKHTEDSSTDAEEGNEEKIVHAKPLADDTVAVVHPPTDHRYPPTIDIADAGEARERLQSLTLTYPNVS